MIEYAFAKEVVATFPLIIKELDRTLKLLYAASSFAACAHSIQALNESVEMMENQYHYYKMVLDKKGKK
jgi:hypothetical protein